MRFCLNVSLSVCVSVKFGLLCFAVVFVLVFVWLRIVFVTPLVVPRFDLRGDGELRLKTHRKLSQSQSSCHGTQMVK